MRPGFLPALLLAGLAAGCAEDRAVRPSPSVASAAVERPEERAPIDWRQVATPADAVRLAEIATAWDEGHAAARRAGLTVAVRRAGAVVDAAAALDRPLPPPGRYQCRTVKLGGRPAFAAFPPFFCFVATEGVLTTLVKETGSERPSGRLWGDGPRRLVFLGSLARDGEKAAPAYGLQAERDLAGVMERIGEFRWRVAFPRPGGRGGIDLIELVPFTAEVTLAGR